MTTHTVDSLMKLADEYASLRTNWDSGNTDQTTPHLVDIAKQALRTAITEALAQTSSQKCWCGTCVPNSLNNMRMILCPDCGNKRCPKANDHRNACTNSNDVGQEGSSWEHVKHPALQAAQPVRGQLNVSTEYEATNDTNTNRTITCLL